MHRFMRPSWAIKDCPHVQVTIRYFVTFWVWRVRPQASIEVRGA
jgi:hypothetical protein